MIAKEASEARALIKRASLHKLDVDGERVPLTDYMPHLVNEGSRNPATGNNLKRQGMIAGVSDYFLAYPVGPYHGFWIELKRNDKKIKPTPSQLIWIARMKKIGYHADVAYGWEDAWGKIMAYLSLPSGHLQE